jgi:hypothetical protein
MPGVISVVGAGMSLCFYFIAVKPRPMSLDAREICH